MNGVIYCRVSSKEQVDGTSLESQELACREYAARNDINVLNVFVERGESAKFADRTQLLELLTFCQDKKRQVAHLLVWKLDRLARNVGDHFNIKALLRKGGVEVISVTEPIDSKPEGKLLETILAGFAQFDNDLRAVRTVQGMRRKLQEGLYPWKPPLGYKTVNPPGSKKNEPDQPDEPLFRLLQLGWNEFASGVLTKAELLRMLNANGVRTRAGAPLTKQSLDQMLRDPFYAGILRDPWSGEEFAGKHLPMISQQVFEKIQEVTKRRNHSVPHVSIRPEFPLRGFARCTACRLYVTGAFSRGRSRYYPYYRCHSDECDWPTNVRQENLHGDFLEFLSSVTPNSRNLQDVREAIHTAASQRFTVSDEIAERRKREREKLEGQIAQLIRMRMEALITDEEFRTNRDGLARRLSELRPMETRTTDELRKMFDAASKPLANLPRTWDRMLPEKKQRFQRMVLPNGFVIGDIGTAQLGCLFSLFRTSAMQLSNVVPLEGRSWNQMVDELQWLSSFLAESLRPASAA